MIVIKAENNTYLAKWVSGICFVNNAYFKSTFIYLNSTLEELSNDILHDSLSQL